MIDYASSTLVGLLFCICLLISLAKIIIELILILEVATLSTTDKIYKNMSNGE